MAQKLLTAEAALTRARKYCSYQERCSSQVTEWLKRLGMTDKQAVLIISDLKKDNFIDDERYARAFARGKLRNNGWGRRKILQGLRACSLTDEIVNTGLQEIDDDEYHNLVERLIERRIKSATSEGELTYTLKLRIMTWAYSRGFEKELIKEIIERFCK